MSYLLQFLLTAGMIFFLARSGNVDGIVLVDGYKSALIFAVILALVNLVLGTILRLVSLPLRIITLGLFSFVISLVVVYVADQLVDGITLVGIIPLVVVALVQSVSAFFMKAFR